MTKRPYITLKIVGIVSLLVAVGGIWYNAQYLSGDYSGVLKKLTEDPDNIGRDYSKFYPVFYTMSGICISFYILLAITGLQLIRVKSQWAYVLVAIVLAEVLYFFLITTFSYIPKYGDSVPAALGVSSGGLMFQILVLFPIWAPVAALWARRRLLREKLAK